MVQEEALEMPGELGRRTVLTRPFKWMFWNAASLALGTFMPEHRPCALARDRTVRASRSSPSVYRLLNK